MDTDRFTKKQLSEYHERMQSFISRNLLECKDKAGRSFWKFKGDVAILNGWEEFHLQAMVGVLEKRPMGWEMDKESLAEMVLNARANLIASGGMPLVWENRPPDNGELDSLRLLLIERGLARKEAASKLRDAVRAAASHH
jgi:hypothetical protein